MNEPQTAVPESKPPEAVLHQLAAIATEHFDGVLIVVSRGKERYDFYQSEDDAHGKASFVISKINRKWWSEKLGEI